MPDIPKLGGLSYGASNDEIIDYIARLEKTIQWMMTGNLSSKNVREIGGWLVSQTELKSRDGTVGFSSANDAADPVRIWAGSTNKDAAPWRVYASGKGVLTGALIRSQNGYPYVEIDPEANLFGAFLSAGYSIRIEPFFGTTSLPSVSFYSGGANIGYLFSDSTAIYLLSLEDLALASPFTITLSGSPIRLNGSTRVLGWDALYSEADAQTLQDVLNSKANAGSSTGSTGPLIGSIPSGTRLAVWGAGDTVSGYVTWTGIGPHSHTQT